MKNLHNPFTGYLLSACLLALAINAHAELVTVPFEGYIRPGYGDTFEGAYTFESTAPFTSHPATSLDIQSAAIRSIYPGTGWNLVVHSSKILDFNLSGDFGFIAIGNDTVYGDKWIVTLYKILEGKLERNRLLFSVRTSQ